MGQKIFPEYLGLLVLNVCGMFISSSANDFFMGHVGIEPQSLCLYIMIFGKRFTLNSGTASLKYFVIGAYASGLLVYGISFIHAAMGTTSIYKIGILMYGMEDCFDTLVFGCGLLLVLIGSFIKSGLVPFHP
jgi:NADH-quinone oxidoreductase subunit N